MERRSWSFRCFSVPTALWPDFRAIFKSTGRLCMRALTFGPLFQNPLNFFSTSPAYKRHGHRLIPCSVCRLRVWVALADALPQHYLERVVELCEHHVRTVVTIGGQTLVPHPKMHPPIQPIEPQKSLVASTIPIFPGFFYGCQ